MAQRKLINRNCGKSRPMRKIFIPAFMLFLVSGSILAQGDIDKVRAYRRAHEPSILAEYFDFLSIPNFALDKVNIQRNAEFIATLLQKRGVEARLLASRTPGTPPVAHGEVLVPGAKRTIVFYAHYDGQSA